MDWVAVVSNFILLFKADFRGAAGTTLTVVLLMLMGCGGGGAGAGGNDMSCSDLRLGGGEPSGCNNQSDGRRSIYWDMLVMPPSKLRFLDEC